MKIKIFVSMHNDSYVYENNSLLCPIQVGTALNEHRFENMIHDDEGENISEKNKMYCELTAQYWAWKNVPDLDYYGFFHYRRYLSFNPIQLDNYENITYFDYCDQKAIDSLMLYEDSMRGIIEKYDAIFPQKNPVGGGTIYDHWCKHLEKKDIDILLQVIIEKYPSFYEIAREVFNSKEAVHCNMFIMKKDIFMDYSEWLFDILGECEKRIDFSCYTTEKLRTLGHMGERLCAVYLCYLEHKNIDILYLQRTLFRHNEKCNIIIARNEKNTIPIVLSCNNSYVKYMSVLIESIIANASENNNYVIYVLNRDITKENECILYEQVKERNNISITFVDVNRLMHEHTELYVDRHLSIETYYRFLLLDVFPNMDKIMYLDCDLIMNEDPAKLFDYDIDNYALGAVRDVDIISLYSKECDRDPDVRTNIDKNIGLNQYTDYFQAGVLLFNLKEIRKKFSGADFFNIAEKKKWKFQDQDILNYMFKGSVKYLPINWNVLYDIFDRVERVKMYAPDTVCKEYVDARNNPKLIHFAGTPKPWDDLNVDFGDYFWKYASKSPCYENVLHEMLQKQFSIELPKKCNDKSLEMQSTIDNLQWQLNEIRNSFTYKLSMAFTYFPRKIRGRKNSNNNE